MNPAAIDDPVAMRHAGRDLLSLALIDARNRTLRWLAAFEGAPPGSPSATLDPPLWWVGEVGWFQERWVGRQLQRLRGEAADGSGPRLASLDPQADDWLDAARVPRAQRWASPPPAADWLRAYLAATLEATLELLETSAESDDALYVFRLALLHEDRVAETLANLAQAQSLAGDRWRELVALPPPRAQREPLWFPSQVARLGSTPGGLVPDNEKWQHDEPLPEFEIDAQVVNWAQYAEFVADGGYDERRWWSEAGWAGVQAEGRRAPKFVEQMAGGVLAMRQGRLQRLGATQAVWHASFHEAQAWCAWAGRRLPTEAEWLLGATRGASRGFVWGDAFEWTLNRARAFPGHADGPARLDAVPAEGSHHVLRGASSATVPRLKHPQARRFAEDGRDELFTGFRSCAV